MQVKKLFVLYRDKENSQIKGKRQLDSIADVLKLLPAKFDELERQAERRKKKNCELQKKNESLKSKLRDSRDENKSYE